MLPDVGWWCRVSVVAEPEAEGRGRSGEGHAGVSSRGGCLLAGEAVAEAPGLGAGVDDVGAGGEAVDDGLGEAGVGEDLGPVAERQVGGDDQRSAFVAFGEDLEDEFGGAVGECDVAQLVDLCGYPHRSTYADSATMPSLSSVGYSKCLLIGWFLVFVPARVSA